NRKWPARDSEFRPYHRPRTRSDIPLRCLSSWRGDFHWPGRRSAPFGPDTWPAAGRCSASHRTFPARRPSHRAETHQSATQPVATGDETGQKSEPWRNPVGARPQDWARRFWSKRLPCPPPTNPEPSTRHLPLNMSAVSETIVREYFELHEFLVRQ